MSDRIQRFIRALAPVAAALLLLLGGTPRAESRGGAPAAGPNVRQPDYVNGGRFFDQAIQYVAAGQAVVHTVKNFYADLEDVQIKLEGNQQEGFLRMWFDQPTAYRYELRPQRSLANTTTKLLKGDQMWVIEPSGQVREMHKSAEGARAMAQMKKDRQRLNDLAQFLTLQSLKGPGIRFDYEGVTKGSGTFEGDWLKINRVVDNVAQVMFFFGYQADQQGRPVRALQPGVVTVVGDPTKREPTEYYLLKQWKKGPYFLFPQRIEAYSQAAPGAPLQRFLLAFAKDIRINARMPENLFASPLASQQPPR